MSAPSRVLVADDHAPTREDVRAAVESDSRFTVVALALAPVSDTIGPPAFATSTPAYAVMPPTAPLPVRVPVAVPQFAAVARICQVYEAASVPVATR